MSVEASELFEVRVEVSFDATHRRGMDGALRGAHSHRWTVAAHARSRKLDSIAIVVDFRRLRDDLEELLGELAEETLEEHPEIGEPATPLVVARWVLGRLRREAEGESWEIHAVEVEADPGIRYVAEASSTASSRS